MSTEEKIEFVLRQNAEIIKLLKELPLTLLPQADEEQPLDDVYYEEPTTAFEAINIANHALATITLIDTDDVELTDNGKRAIIRVKKKALKLLDWGVNEAYDSVFDENKD